MMLRTTLAALAIVALAACGDDTGGAGGGGEGGSSTTATGSTTASGSTTSSGDGGSTSTGDGGSTSTGDGGSTSTGDGGAGGGTTGQGGGTAYDCASYCADVMEACADGLAQYPNAESCEASCAAFEVGEFQDTGNTLGCRAYHATAALDSPEVHCPHAGPLGTGACSADATSPCEAFCAIAEEICPGSYDSVAACEKVCAGYTAGDYNAGQGTEPADDSLACRMYHLSVAAIEGNAEVHCPHIVGDSPTCPAPQ
jgi:hypothetical protein